MLLGYDPGNGTRRASYLPSSVTLSCVTRIKYPNHHFQSRHVTGDNWSETQRDRDRKSVFQGGLHTCSSLWETRKWGVWKRWNFTVVPSPVLHQRQNHISPSYGILLICWCESCSTETESCLSGDREVTACVIRLTCSGQAMASEALSYCTSWLCSLLALMPIC